MRYERLHRRHVGGTHNLIIRHCPECEVTIVGEDSDTIAGELDVHRVEAH